MVVDNHFRYEKQIDHCADQHNTASNQPDKSSPNFPQIETVESQDAKPTDEPEKICNEC